MPNKNNNQKEVSKIIEAKLPEVDDYEEYYGQPGARRDKKKAREKTNEKSGGTLAGQQQRMKSNLGYRRTSKKQQGVKVRIEK